MLRIASAVPTVLYPCWLAPGTPLPLATVNMYRDRAALVRDRSLWQIADKSRGDLVSMRDWLERSTCVANSYRAPLGKIPGRTPCLGVGRQSSSDRMMTRSDRSIPPTVRRGGSQLFGEEREELLQFFIRRLATIFADLERFGVLHFFSTILAVPIR